jgi:hypothetical protein
MPRRGVHLYVLVPGCCKSNRGRHLRCRLRLVRNPRAAASGSPRDLAVAPAASPAEPLADVAVTRFVRIANSHKVPRKLARLMSKDPDQHRYHRQAEGDRNPALEIHLIARTRWAGRPNGTPGHMHDPIAARE